MYHHYLVVYSNGAKRGRCGIVRPGPITSMDDVEEVEATISAMNGLTPLMVENFVLLDINENEDP